MNTDVMSNLQEKNHVQLGEKGVEVFNNPEFGNIRVIRLNNDIYFVGKDIAEALGYKNTKDAISTHVSDEDKKIIQRSEIATIENHLSEYAFSGNPVNAYIPNRGLTVINESGLYSLILSSKLESSKRFKRWITSEVLPSIRRNGGYIVNQEELTPEQIVANALIVAQNIIRQKDKQIEQMRPKEIFADAVATSTTCILIGDLAKLLKQNGVDTGQKRLFQWMRNNGYLIKRNGTDYNMPTQRSMEQGLFEVKESTINNPDGSVRINKTTKVTGKGQQYFINLFLSGNNAYYGK